MNELKKIGILNQYRDWLLPISIFTGISVSVFLFILNITNLSILLIISAILSIILFIVALLYIVTKLELFELANAPVVYDKGTLFVLIINGIILFCISLLFLSFWKSTLLGFIVSGIFVLTAYLLIIARKANK